MTEYWIRDAELRVLGPVSLAVLRDLVTARRLVGVEQVSRDGLTWTPVEAFPELAAALAPPPAEDARAGEVAEAARLRERVKAAEGRAAHEVFNVPPDAPLATWRGAYFALARRFHPSRLPPQAHPELVAACQEAFRFFAQRIAEVERRLAPQAPTPTPAPAGAASPPPAPAARPPPAAAPREYQPEDFVGIERRNDRICANVRLTPANWRMFTEHQLVNLSSGGMFLATQTLIPLGTLVELEMLLEESGQRISARARVVWENSGQDGRHARGVGLKFTLLSDGDAQLLRTWVQRSSMLARRA